MKISDREIFRLHAEFCKTLSNPTRLMIIALLSKRELTVGEIADATDTALATISQHLRVLRARNIVNTRKEGQTVFCVLADHRLMKACVIIRTVLLDIMKQRGTLAAKVRSGGVSMQD